MKTVFFALILLIVAPVKAMADDDMAAFLHRYHVFNEQRQADQARPSQAVFTGSFQFKEEACPLGTAAGFGQGGIGNGLGQPQTLCACPQGNTYLQCLKSASVTIKADPADIGGRAFILLEAGNTNFESIMLQNGQWVPSAQLNNGVYSMMFDPLQSKTTFSLQIPKTGSVSMCSSDNQSVSIRIGYGAVMPMDIEYASRAKAVAANYGKDFDVDGNLWVRAFINGYKPNKSGIVGTLTCRPSAGIGGV